MTSDPLSIPPEFYRQDPDAVVEESRRVADLLRACFGTCEAGSTDLHVLARTMSAVFPFWCLKCGRGLR